MTRNILFKNWAVSLIVAAIFSACTDKKLNGDEEDICPTKSIIGKWELVEFRGGILQEPRKHEPRGYVEYLADGRFRWFDYTTKEYTLFESKFRMEQSFRVFNPDGYEWQLYYEMTKIEFDNGKLFYVCPEFPDKPLGCSFLIRFIDQNTKSLWTTDHWIVPEPYFIYRRIKQ